MAFHWNIYSLLRHLQYWIRQWLIAATMTFTALAFNLKRGRSHQLLRTKEMFIIYCPITSTPSEGTSGKKRGQDKGRGKGKKKAKTSKCGKNGINQAHNGEKSSWGTQRRMSANCIISWCLFYLRWQVCQIHNLVELLWPVLNGCVGRLQIRQ